MMGSFEVILGRAFPVIRYKAFLLDIQSDQGSTPRIGSGISSYWFYPPCNVDDVCESGYF
jgi:hypothetical protein